MGVYKRQAVEGSLYCVEQPLGRDTYLARYIPRRSSSLAIHLARIRLVTLTLRYRN